MLSTGRVVFQFHTRTKTARSVELNEAAPDSFLQISDEDASKYGITSVDWVEVRSRRGMIQVKAKIGGITNGDIFVPFHYGYWDGDIRPRAANEITITEWDPVSKQPRFKYSAVKIKKINLGDLVKDPDRTEQDKGVVETLSEVAKSAAEIAKKVF